MLALKREQKGEWKSGFPLTACDNMIKSTVVLPLPFTVPLPLHVLPLLCYYPVLFST